MKHIRTVSRTPQQASANLELLGELVQILFAFAIQFIFQKNGGAIRL